MAVKLTDRDARLVRDVALSHVLSRDQFVALGYFGSVTRANTRLRMLRELGMVKVLSTPFFNQQLYAIGPWADSILPEELIRLIRGRSTTPRFVQHALCVTNVRIHALKKGASHWFFEPQVRVSFDFAGMQLEVRPDGAAKSPNGVTVFEVDLGHVASAKFKEKLRAYDAFAASSSCRRAWGASSFRVLTVTTGKLRAKHLNSLVPAQSRFEFLAVPASDLGIEFAGSWS